MLGLFGVAISAFILQSGTAFPGPSAALPVLSTGLILVAGLGAPTGGWTVLMTNRFSRYLGRISFSLYLWHWPVIIVMHALLPDRPRAGDAIAVTAMLGLSVFSFHFIESPFRQLSVTRFESAMSWQSWRRGIHRNWIPAAVSIVLVVVAVTGYIVKSAPVIPAGRINLALTDSAVNHRPQPSYVAAPSITLSSDIDNALVATKWPALNPSLDSLSISSAQASWRGCRGGTEATCTFGQSGSTKSAVVIGDSYAMSWLPALRTALLSSGWVIHGLTMEGCPAEDVAVDDFRTPPKPSTAANPVTNG